MRHVITLSGASTIVPGHDQKAAPDSEKPEIAPTTSPTAIRRAAIHGVKRTFELPPAAARERHADP
jgi:hypothetical protein